MFSHSFAHEQLREKEEDMKILEYIRAKDAREQELAYEKERIRHEKEMETVRLRTMQVCLLESTMPCWRELREEIMRLWLWRRRWLLSSRLYMQCII